LLVQLLKLTRKSRHSRSHRPLQQHFSSCDRELWPWPSNWPRQCQGEPAYANYLYQNLFSSVS